jgi:hypothetical protein
MNAEIVARRAYFEPQERKATWLLGGVLRSAQLSRTKIDIANIEFDQLIQKLLIGGFVVCLFENLSKRYLSALFQQINRASVD